MQRWVSIEPEAGTDAGLEALHVMPPANRDVEAIARLQNVFDEFGVLETRVFEQECRPLTLGLIVKVVGTPEVKAIIDLPLEL